jgi:hypothetical protein
MRDLETQPPRLDYIVGLDLGPMQDPSALAVLERATPPTPKRAGVKREPTRYACRHLERWHPGSPYTAIVDGVVALFAKPPLRGSTLVVDQTGVGRAVVDLLRHAKADGSLRAKLFPVTITPGHAVVPGGDGSWHVAKKHPVAALQVLLQAGQLKIARELPDADVLIKELDNYRPKVSLAAGEADVWRDGAHHDLVLAVAIAAWFGQRCPPVGIVKLPAPVPLGSFPGLLLPSLRERDSAVGLAWLPPLWRGSSSGRFFNFRPLRGGVKQ